MLRQTNRRVILFYEKMAHINEHINEYDILLTPKFYVLRREKLPIKFSFQAKKLAPSILDELTQESEEVEYVVYKDGQEWVFIAYNPSLIFEYAKKSGLDPNSARSIYFVEQIRDRLKQPVCVGDDYALAVIEEYVTLIPKSFIGDEGCKKIDSFPMKDYKAYACAVNSSTISPIQSYIIASALSMMAVLIFVDGIRYSNTAKHKEDKIADAADGDPVLMSKISRDNILNKYRHIDKKQREIRETLKQIGYLLNNSVELDSFKSDEKGFVAVLKSLNSSAMKVLAIKVKNKGFKYKISGKEMIINGRWR